MLSLFPQILWLAPFSALLLRLAVAAFLGFAAWQHVGYRSNLARGLSAVEMLLAAALIVGAWTQATALIAALACIAHLTVPSLRTSARSTAALVLIMCLSLVVTGAGALAFDLPL